MNKVLEFLEEKQSAGSYLEAVQSFLTEKINEGLSSASVFHLYRSLLAAGCALDHKPIAELSASDLSTYAASLRRRYAPGTLRTIIGDLKQFHRWAKKHGWTKKNLAKSLKKPKAKPTGIKAAPEPSIQAVIEYLAQKMKPLVYRDLFGQLRTSDPEWSYHELKLIHDLFAIVFLYETGCRAGELANLKTSDMQRATRTLQAVYLVESWGKTGDQQLRFTDRSAELFRLWASVRPFSFDTVICSWKLGHKPKAAKTNGISQMLVRRCNQAGVEPFRAHALRHAKVRRSRRVIGIELTAKLLGHSSLAVTQGYANVDDDELSQAAIATGLKFDPW